MIGLRNFKTFADQASAEVRQAGRNRDRSQDNGSI